MLVGKLNEAGDFGGVNEAIGIGIERVYDVLALPGGEVLACEMDEPLEFLLAYTPIFICIKSVQHPPLELLQSHYAFPISRHATALYGH